MTCREWAKNLVAERDEIVKHWGEKVYRAFRLYLWGASYSFVSRGMDAFRVVLERPEDMRCNSSPSESNIRDKQNIPIAFMPPQGNGLAPLCGARPFNGGVSVCYREYRPVELAVKSGYSRSVIGFLS